MTDSKRSRTGPVPVVEALESRRLLADVGGALRAWEPVTLDFHGPNTSETASSPNPFVDFRLQVRFMHAGSGATLDVPGYYDGNVVGGSSGNAWRARFTPPCAGRWDYTASFRTGSQEAVSFSPTAGTATGFNGDAGGHYLRFDDGTWFVKTGIASPANMLAFDGFDNTIGTHR